MKKILTLLLILPLLLYCTPQKTEEPKEDEQEQQQKPDEKPDDEQGKNNEETPVDVYAKASPELHNGDVLQATNPNVEKFLSEVTYPDKDLSFTHILEYYGGFNNVTYDENGNPDPNGVIFNWKNQPNSDKPCSYSIRWKPEDLEEGKAMNLHMEDTHGWKGDLEISAGMCYVNVTNLVPNDQYTYRVTTESGKVLSEGAFSTTGKAALHQVFFSSGCRNGRDLGGWKTLDGKTVKYRMMYRGGRMQSETVNKSGKKEILFEGIGAQLDLRNNDRLSKPAVEGLEFCAPGIEEGGTWMLKNGNDNGNFGKQCFEFTVNSLRAGKPVFFHCSLGRDRTGTFDILCLGLLGVREGDISKAYEVTYFAPVGYSVSSSEKNSPTNPNPIPIFRNTRMEWAYADVAPYFWSLSQDGTFANGVEHYLLDVAGVSQKDIDDFRNMMLE